MDRRKLLLISSCTVHGFDYLQYAGKEIKDFLGRHAVKKILFIPYALPDYDKFHKRVNNVFNQWGFETDSIHRCKQPKNALKKAEAYFVGGGNTFLLLNSLYEQNLMGLIRDCVVKNGIPYIGTSAGTNIATASINTANDMPIVRPPTFDALKLVPFNINAHYLDAAHDSIHLGDNREERILQYLEIAPTTVLAMREGVHLLVEKGVATLKGINKSRLFVKNEDPQELESGADVSFLLDEN